MGDVYEEILIRKEKTGADTAKKIGLIAAVALIAVVGVMYMPLLIVVAIAAGAGAYYLIQGLNVEYEYQYVNGDFDVDKIMNMSRRKKAGSFELANLEYIAPSASHELDSYMQRKALKVIDYSSGKENAKTFTAVYNGEGGAQAVIFEDLTEEIFKDLRRQAPRKVSRECL